MSIAVSVLQATQDMLRLSVVTSGADNTTLTQAALAALCVPGPLKSLINAPLFQASTGSHVDGLPPSAPGVAEWANLTFDARLSVHVASNGTTAQAVGTYNFQTASGVNQLYLGVSNTGTMVYELIYRHTITR